MGVNYEYLLILQIEIFSHNSINIIIANINLSVFTGQFKKC